MWTQAQQNAYLRTWRATRRAKGLCSTCPAQSDRYSRCIACRQRANAKRLANGGQGKKAA